MGNRPPMVASGRIRDDRVRAMTGRRSQVFDGTPKSTVARAALLPTDTARCSVKPLARRQQERQNLRRRTESVFDSPDREVADRVRKIRG
jgi:hypothetical protein